MKKIITIVGARPQFIKASAVSRVIRQNYSDSLNEIIIHTGQHYDSNMSQVFFDELQIPLPKYNLSIAGGLHGAMTGRMMESIEKVLCEEKPEWVLIYGDTNSTLAGALAAAKLNIPVAHIEAGLRSSNMRMPEEVNRILADRVSKLLFCPTHAAVANLRKEGVDKGIHHVGDVMYDVALFYKELSLNKSNIMQRLLVETGQFVLATCHRAENTDSTQRMSQILKALSKISERHKVLLPLHPRTRKIIHDYGLDKMLESIEILEPLSFLDMIALEQSACAIVTDSGGVQKEAFFYGVPCITMRDETEWTETISSGWNTLAGADSEKIVEAISKPCPAIRDAGAYGDGHAAVRIVDIMNGY